MDFDLAKERGVFPAWLLFEHPIECKLTDRKVTIETYRFLGNENSMRIKIDDKMVVNIEVLDWARALFKGENLIRIDQFGMLHCTTMVDDDDSKAQIWCKREKFPFPDTINDRRPAPKPPSP